MHYQNKMMTTGPDRIVVRYDEDGVTMFEEVFNTADSTFTQVRRYPGTMAPGKMECLARGLYPNIKDVLHEADSSDSAKKHGLN